MQKGGKNSHYLLEGDYLKFLAALPDSLHSSVLSIISRRCWIYLGQFCFKKIVHGHKYMVQECMYPHFKPPSSCSPELIQLTACCLDGLRVLLTCTVPSYKTPYYYKHYALSLTVVTSTSQALNDSAAAEQTQRGQDSPDHELLMTRQFEVHESVQACSDTRNQTMKGSAHALIQQ
jgi:hypothetical protein